MVCCVAVMALWGLVVGGVRAVTSFGGRRDTGCATETGFAPAGRHAGPVATWLASGEAA